MTVPLIALCICTNETNLKKYFVFSSRVAKIFHTWAAGETFLWNFDRFFSLC